ncbi:MAG: hypothetical protein HPY57_15955 [Ignavibacteria bacterium]|nr:hypothetical protein [Ignavibacteria bacterium]
MIETIDRLSKKYPDVNISATIAADIFIYLTFKNGKVISFSIKNKPFEEQIEEKILGYKRLIRIKKLERIC